MATEMAVRVHNIENKLQVSAVNTLSNLKAFVRESYAFGRGIACSPCYLNENRTENI